MNISTPTRSLLESHGAETVNGRFRLAGIEITSLAMIPHDDGGEAYLNGLKPSAYVKVGGFWKAAWIRQARYEERKAALRNFFTDYERLHGIKAGRQPQ